MSLIDFLKWYALALVISWLNLPLTYRLFKSLPSRGFALSRPLGLLLWGYLFWLLTSLKLLNNDLAGQLAALFLLGALNIAAWPWYFEGIGDLDSGEAEVDHFPGIAVLLWLRAVVICARGQPCDSWHGKTDGDGIH